MNYYDILNVTKNASKKEIKNSYKNLVKKYHPDVYSGDKSFAEKKIKEINSAYDVLSDDLLRKEYDLSLSGGYEFDESAAKEEAQNKSTVTPKKKESYEEFYSSSNNDVDPSSFNPKSTDLEDDVYENYKKVYNDFVNKNTTASSDTYTRAKETYTDYYRASTYRRPSYSSNPEARRTENIIEKKVYSFSKLNLFFIFIIAYFFAVIFILSDLKELNKPKTHSEDVYSNYINDNYDSYDSSYNDITETETNYDEYYILGGYEISLDELKVLYNQYYSTSFSTFDEFMTFIEDAEGKL